MHTCEMLDVLVRLPDQNQQIQEQCATCSHNQLSLLYAIVFLLIPLQLLCQQLLSCLKVLRKVWQVGIDGLQATREKWVTGCSAGLLSLRHRQLCLQTLRQVWQVDIDALQGMTT